MDSLAAIYLLVLGLFLVAAGFWIWLAAGASKPGFRGLVGAVAIQLSAVAFVYYYVLGAGLGVLFGAAFPPSLLWNLGELRRFHALLAPTYPYALAASAVVLLAFNFLLRRWRRWCVAPTLLAMLVAVLIVAEKVSQEAMCRSAETEGIASFRRNTLLWSLANASQEFHDEIHAIAERDGQRLGWSYRKMEWYLIPATHRKVSGPPFVCRT